MGTTASKVAKKKATKPAATDMIVSTSTEVENLTREDALNLVPELINDIDFNFFKIGGILTRVQEEGWWEEQAETFREYVENVFGLKYRKAMYLIGIYNSLVESGVPWSKVRTIGWSKLKEIADHIDKKNVTEWVNRAKEMTVLQLQEYVKQLETADGGEGETASADKAASVSTMTFKVHEDQKETIRHALDKAKVEGNTDVDTVALEYICVQYIESTTGKKKGKATLSLDEMIAKGGLEKSLEAVEKAFPDVEITATVNE